MRISHHTLFTEYRELLDDILAKLELLHILFVKEVSTRLIHSLWSGYSRTGMLRSFTSIPGGLK